MPRIKCRYTNFWLISIFNLEKKINFFIEINGEISLRLAQRTENVGKVKIKLPRLRLKCDGTRAEARFRLSTKRTSLFKLAGASVQSTTGNRGVRISGNNAGYNTFRGSVKGTGYPLHSPVSTLLSLPASPCAITFQLDSTSLSVWRWQPVLCCLTSRLVISVRLKAGWPFLNLSLIELSVPVEWILWT